MRKPRNVVVIFFLLLWSSCSVELPNGVISEGRMEAILHDYHIAQGMAEAEGGNIDENRYLYVQKVFEKYGVTEAEFDSSMIWYSGHTSYLEKIYKRIDARLERESREAGLNIPEEDKFARFTSEGDTANIWQGRDMLFINGNREQNIYSLVIPADSTFHRGDYFMFRCANRFIVQDGQREAFVLLQVRYDNDSTVCNTIMVSGDYDTVLNIVSESVPNNHNVKSITVTFYYSFDEGRDDAFRMWVVRKPVLLRYHNMKMDTISTIIPDTLAQDTISLQEQTRGERLSPAKFRESQQVDKKINVVQKRNVVLPAKPQRRVIKSTR